MNQVQNNITLNAFREAFDASPRTKEQLKSFEEFCKVGLPTNKSEEYRFTPVGKFLEANFDLAFYGQSPKSDFDPELNQNEISVTIFNGRLIEPSHNEDGLTIKSAEGFNTAQSNDPFVLLNKSFNSQEIQITVDANKTIGKTIKINHILDSEENQVMVNPRLVIHVGENASVNIIESFSSSGINSVFSNIVTEFTLSENSVLNYYRLQDDAGTYQVYHSLVKQLGKSVVNSFVFSFDGNVIRNNSIFSIEKEFCESNFYGLYLPTGKSLIDNHTVADHKVPNCVSNELYKGIMNEQAKGVFNGKIFVRPHAQKTNAFQSNRNILLTDTATINTKPQLEIWADDVKCSHGCTTGQLNKEALFYLQSRGIDVDDARTMLLAAFASEVVEKIADTELREEIKNIVSSRLTTVY
jgi:Fe-S cluster assembly protein SufD